jgi:hypothetical protein
VDMFEGFTHDVKVNVLISRPRLTPVSIVH